MLNYKKNRGFSLIFLSIGMVMVLGGMSVTLQLFGNRQARQNLENLNRREGFYSGELAVWSGYFRGKALLPVGMPITLLEEATSVPTDPYDPNTYEPGKSLSHSSTKEFDSATTIIRRYTGTNLGTSQKERGALCGQMELSKKTYRTCLTSLEKAPPSAPSTLTHMGSRIIDLRANQLPVNVESIALQKEGKILVVGSSNCNGSIQFDRFIDNMYTPHDCYSWRILRFHPSGEIDESFGDFGVASSSIQNRVNFPTRLFILSDGKFIVGGFNSSESRQGSLSVVRYTENGEEDLNFGTAGIASLPFEAASHRVQTLLVDPGADGKILIGASDSSDGKANFFVTRLNSNGLLDTAFGKQGKVTFNLKTSPEGYPSRDYLTDMALLENGKILILGASTIDGETQTDIGLLRLLPDGNLDTSFGNGGKLLLPPDSSQTAFTPTTLFPLPGGSFLIGGGLGKPHENRNSFLMQRLSGGEKDTSFGENGLFLTSLSQDNIIRDIKMADDKIYCLGSNEAEALNGRLFHLRLESNGKLDSTFGSGGMLYSETSPPFLPNSTNKVWPEEFLISNSKFTSLYDWNSFGYFMISRHHLDGSLDKDFGKNGIALNFIGHSEDFGQRVAFLPDGTPLLVGDVIDRNRLGFVNLSLEATLNPKFILPQEDTCKDDDTSIGIPGRVRHCLRGIAYTRVPALAIHDNMLVVAGAMKNLIGEYRMIIEKFHLDGKLDKAFGKDGFTDLPYQCEASMGVTTNAALDHSYKGAQALLIEASGKIILGGCKDKGDFLIIRLEENGSLDPQFGKGGVSIVNFKEKEGKKSTDMLFSLALQKDGKIVAVGGSRLQHSSGAMSGGWGTSDMGDTYLALARFLAHGELDTSFGEEGKVLLLLPEVLDKKDDRGPTSGFSVRQGFPHAIGYDVAIDNEGKILVAGTAGVFDDNPGNGYKFLDSLMVRFLPDGSLDTSFGKGGKVLMDFSPYFPTNDMALVPMNRDAIFSLVLLPDGKILTSPTLHIRPNFTSNNTESQFSHTPLLLALFNPDGTLDTPSGEGGFLRHYSEGLVLL